MTDPIAPKTDISRDYSPVYTNTMWNVLGVDSDRTSENTLHSSDIFSPWVGVAVVDTSLFEDIWIKKANMAFR